MMTQENQTKVITHFQESGQESAELFDEIIKAVLTTTNYTEIGREVSSILSRQIKEALKND